MVGLSTVQWAGLVTLGVGLTFPVLAWFVWDERDKPGATWFLGALGGSFGWLLGNGFARLTENAPITEALVSSGYLFTGVAIACWLAVIYEFVSGNQFPAHVFPLLLAIPVAEQLMLLFSPTRHFVHAEGSTVDAAGIFHVDPGPMYLLTMGYYLALVLIALGMLLPAWVRSQGSRRSQVKMLLFATAVGILLSVFVVTDTGGAFHPFLVMFPAINGILALALLRYRLFEVTTVGRETTVREMDDAVIIVDVEGTVTDANPTARAWFDFGEADIGADVEEVFADVPALLETFEREPPVRTERALTVEGSERYVDVQLTDISDGNVQRGKVVVLRDITTLKQREQDLDLLKQVFARVFRHNVRNEMSIVEAYAQATRDRADDDVALYMDEILTTSDSLLAHSEKAQVIESVVDESRLVELDLAETVRSVVAATTERDTEVAIEYSLPTSLPVYAHPELAAAIRELIDNAIEHAPDGTTPRLEIWVEENPETVTLVIEDESGGVSEYEIEILEEAQEGALKHGSGLGLWLVRFVLERSEGSMTLERTDEGTRATLSLQRVQS